jgi:hypothetical protein
LCAVILVVAAWGCASSAGVAASHERGSLQDRPRLVVDFSFADLALKEMAGDASALPQLLAHPGLTALWRHHRMGGGTRDRIALLETILSKPAPAAQVRRVVDYWRERQPRLAATMDTVRDYLPVESLHGAITAYFVVNYDIGAAAAPDLAVNAAVPRFGEKPREVEYIVAHELHHVGFATWRPHPSWRFRTASDLRTVIDHATQLEGMAVFAGYASRATDGTLADDPDYRGFVDAKHARRICARYREVLEDSGRIDASDPVETETILHRMSSGERLWYQLGGLVARRVEQTRGRVGLLATVKDPAPFLTARDELLATCDIR